MISMNSNNNMFKKWEPILRVNGNWKMKVIIISQKYGMVIDGPFNETKEVISGYYHILSSSLEEAIEIGIADPRFEDGDWRLEVRPILKVDGIN